jgi:hypothetical protein
MCREDLAAAHRGTAVRILTFPFWEDKILRLPGHAALPVGRGNRSQALGNPVGGVKAADSDAERRRDARLAMASGNRCTHFEAALTIATLPARTAFSSGIPSVKE